MSNIPDAYDPNSAPYSQKFHQLAHRFNISPARAWATKSSSNTGDEGWRLNQILSRMGVEGGIEEFNNSSSDRQTAIESKAGSIRQWARENISPDDPGKTIHNRLFNPDNKFENFRLAQQGQSISEQPDAAAYNPDTPLGTPAGEGFVAWQGGFGGRALGSGDGAVQRLINAMGINELDRDDRQRLNHAASRLGFDSADNMASVLNANPEDAQLVFDQIGSLADSTDGSIRTQSEFDTAFISWQDDLEPESPFRFRPNTDTPLHPKAGHLGAELATEGREFGVQSRTEQYRDRYELRGDPDNTADDFDPEGLDRSQRPFLDELSFGIDDDATNAQTTRESIANDFATRFIDELYGTEGGEYRTQDFAGDDAGIIFEASDHFNEQGFDEDGVHVKLYGLDLTRTMVDDNGDAIVYDNTQGADNQAYYEHITRGTIDWGSYTSDPAYNQAFQDLEMNIQDLQVSNLTLPQRANMIRRADEHLADNPEIRENLLSDDQASDGKLDMSWMANTNPNKYVQLEQDGITETYKGGVRQIRMEERLSIPPGETMEVLVSPPHMPEQYVTVESQYMNFETSTIRNEEDDGNVWSISTPDGQTTISVDIPDVYVGRDLSYLDGPSNIPGMTYDEAPSGNPLHATPRLTNPTVAKERPSAETIPVRPFTHDTSIVNPSSQQLTIGTQTNTGESNGVG